MNGRDSVLVLSQQSFILVCEGRICLLCVFHMMRLRNILQTGASSLTIRLIISRNLH